jgi:hypothetical protein
VLYAFMLVLCVRLCVVCSLVVLLFVLPVGVLLMVMFAGVCSRCRVMLICRTDGCLLSRRFPLGRVNSDAVTGCSWRYSGLGGFALFSSGGDGDVRW